MANDHLRNAKREKNDEFYTQYADIQKEVEAYLEFNPHAFRDKVVYCNCDDPFESNFFKYFAANFNKLGLKKLITTSYDGSPIAGAQLTFGEYTEGNGKRPKPKAIAVEIEEVKDVNGDGATGIEDVKLFLKQNPHTRKRLAGVQLPPSARSGMERIRAESTSSTKWTPITLRHGVRGAKVRPRTARCFALPTIVQKEIGKRLQSYY